MYRIINEKTIQKRIEELEQLRENSETREGWYYIDGKITEAKNILSTSIPLIPEIEKSFEAGINIKWKGLLIKKQEIEDSKTNYISQLKLDI